MAGGGGLKERRGVFDNGSFSGICIFLHMGAFFIFFGSFRRVSWAGGRALPLDLGIIILSGATIVDRRRRRRRVGTVECLVYPEL